MTYTALLRAVNVGGRTVKMERLRDLFSELELGNVRSFIQSGNVFFDTPRLDREELTREIEGHLAASLGFSVPVILRTVAELKEIIQRNPFQHTPVDEHTRLYLIFCAQPLPENLTLPHTSESGEFTIIGRTTNTAFVVMRILNARSGNPNAYIEKLYTVTATGRFYHTTINMLAAAQQ